MRREDTHGPMRGGSRGSITAKNSGKQTEKTEQPGEFTGGIESLRRSPLEIELQKKKTRRGGKERYQSARPQRRTRENGEVEQLCIVKSRQRGGSRQGEEPGSSYGSD